MFSKQDDLQYSLSGPLTGPLAAIPIKLAKFSALPVATLSGARQFARLMSSRTVQPGYAANAGSNGTTDIDSNTRSSHFNEFGCTVNKLKLMYAGWYCRSTGGTGDADAPNDVTINAAIEYPAGNFSAPVTINLVAGTNQLSTEIVPASPIPAGAQFWVRTYVAVTSGQKWLPGYAINSSLGEASDRNTATDKTVSGTISGSSTGLGPLAIIATAYTGVAPRAFAGFGDSLTEGGTVSIQDIHGNIGTMGFACTGNAPYMNLGRGGLTAANSTASMARRLDALTKAGITDCSVTLGTNDLALGGSLATCETNVQAAFDAIAALGIRVYCNTLPPQVTYSTGKPAVPGVGISVAGWSAAGGASNRGLFNAWLRAGRANVYAIFDVGDQVETSRDSAVWKTDDVASGTRILGTVNATVTGSPTTTVIPTDLTTGSGIGANALSSGGASILFTSGVNNGVVRAILSNTNFGASLTLTAALSSAPAAGDTFTIYRNPYTFEGTHPFATGHNSALSLYYGGAFVLADYISNILFGTNATA